MANENKYLRNIYINGVPYRVRDEECRTTLLQMREYCDTINTRMNTINSIINGFYSNETGKFTGGESWDVWSHDQHRNGSKIPYFEEEALNDNYTSYKLKIGEY